MLILPGIVFFFNKIVLFAATEVSGVVLYDDEKLKTAEKT